jgi:glyoxylase-like metal-dependent hydrolase (beta-lactamase superfamily II)
MYIPIRSRVRHALAAVLLFSALGCATTPAPQAVMNTELLKPGLHRVSGQGGSSLLRSSPDGVIVVDSRRAGMYEPLMAEVARIAKTSSPRVRALILTGSGPEQAGNAARFADAGVPVVVQRRAFAGSGLPPARVVRYDADHRLLAGGVVVEVEHVGSGRSGADSIVLFPDLRIAAIGDLYTAEEPTPDCAAGGSFLGWAAAIAHLLYWDFELAVPSHGPPVGKPELLAFKGRLEALAAERRPCG